MANKYAQQSSAQSNAKAKSSLRNRIIAGIAAFVLIVGVTILILSFITIKPADLLNEANLGYRVEIANNSSSSQTLDGTVNQLTDFNKSYKKTSFSVMRGILEGRTTSKLVFDIQSDDDGEVTNGIPASELEIIENNASSSKFMVKLRFDGKQTVNTKVKDADDKDIVITYDKAVFFVTDTGNKISKVQVYFFDTSSLDNDEYMSYNAYFYGNTYSLFNYLNDYFKAFN